MTTNEKVTIVLENIIKTLELQNQEIKKIKTIEEISDQRSCQSVPVKRQEMY